LQRTAGERGRDREHENVHRASSKSAVEPRTLERDPVDETSDRVQRRWQRRARSQ
jgi:hypothetical protein